MNSLLKHIARFSYQHHLVTLLLVATLSGISLLLAYHLELKTNFVSLLPQESRTVRVFFESIDDFGMSDFFIVCLKTDDPQNTDRMMDLADEIVTNIQDSDLIEYIDYRLGDKEKDFYKEVFLKNMILFMDAQGLQLLRRALTDEEIQATIRKNKELLLSQVSLGVKKAIMDDPLRLADIYRNYLPGQKGNLKFDLSDGYYLTHDQKMLLILVKPLKSFNDLEYNRDLLQTVSQAVGKAQENLRERDSFIDSDTESPVIAAYTGGHVITLADAQVIRWDVIRTMITSFIGICLLFVFAFRRLETILYIGLPLLNGVIWSLGFSYVTIGSLNLITSVTSAIVMGLGVDFAIHIYNRYLDERDHNRGPLVALENSFGKTGIGALTGAITTAVAFFSMILAPFKGLQEFGFMAGSGILLSFCSIIITLPALIRLRDKSRIRNVARRPMRSFYVQYVAAAVIKYPYLTLFCGALISVLALFQIPRVTFSDSTVDLRAQSNKYMAVRDEVQEKIGGSLRYFLIVLRGPDVDSVLVQNNRLVELLKPLVVQRKINMMSSIQDYLPPPDKQLENMSLIHADQAFSAQRIQETFYQALKHNGFRLVPGYERYISNLTQSLSVSEPFTYNNYRQLGLERFLNRFIRFTNTEVRVALYLFPREQSNYDNPAHRQQVMTEIQAILRANQIDADLTGTMPVTQTLKRLVIESINKITSVAFLFVIIVLAIHFRRVRSVIGALVPMTVGMLWMVGTMPLIGLSLNFFNIAIIPIIVGIGIDDGVHILHRYREGKQRDLVGALHLSGKAVVMTSFTTIIAFGSLYFSDYKGLSAMGYLAITGVSFTLISTITLLPALIILINRLKYRFLGKNND